VAGSAHQVGAERRAHDACVVSDPGSDPDSSLAARRFDSRLVDGGRALELDIADPPYGLEVRAPFKSVVAIRKAHGDVAKAARLHALLVRSSFLATIELRSHDRVSRMARLQSLREFRLARTIAEKSLAVAADAAGSASRQTLGEQHSSRRQLDAHLAPRSCCFIVDSKA
jgi:hypothetical protein